MKIFSFLVFAVLFLGCKENTEEVVDMTEIMPSSKDYKDGPKEDDTSNLENVTVNTGLDHSLLDEAKIELSKLAVCDTLLFPDRFSPIRLTKFTYASENETILFSSFRFKDSIKTKNVFLNWTNCFGSNCKSARIGEVVNLQKEGFLLMTNDTSIIYIGANSLAEQKKWINHYTTEKDIRWNFILSQAKGGKLIWNEYLENKMMPIEARIME